MARCLAARRRRAKGQSRSRRERQARQCRCGCHAFPGTSGRARAKSCGRTPAGRISGDMKLSVPADYFYVGSPAQTFEVNTEKLKALNPATAWDEHIAREVARQEKLKEKSQ